ncbi:NmrA/HSCARG family protein [Roseateles sp.]|uniref:NmrA/HSCARG family protein n=1 Tax=Roseateles sp. TaxID=1971397 RepID=UPI0025D29707|nr:NmrA/HSCARG family protein [Roseateles sp.]MBV8034351.1 NmrA/HSCARG family protein [Roseateles sp.]
MSPAWLPEGARLPPGGTARDTGGAPANPAVHHGRPVIAVFGATGAQGGGLARALLRDPWRRFAVRALTRQPGARAARALAQAGAEVVQADLDRPGTLAAALDGAHGVFGVTDFWEHFSPERELQQAAQLASAAARAGVRHLVWSTQEDTRAGASAWAVPQMDAKGQADAFFRALPTTYLLPSFYWDNFIHLGLHPQREPDGRLLWPLPLGGARLCGIAAEDIGNCVAALFVQGEAVIGERIGLAGEQLTGAQMAEVLSRVLGEPVRHQAIAPAAFGRQPFPGASEMARMFAYQQAEAASYCAARAPEIARALHPGLLGFAQWAQSRADVLRHLAAAPGGRA